MRLISALTLLLLLPLTALGADGVISVKSHHSVSETLDKLEGILKGKGFKIIARINHGAAAAKVGFEIRDTELLIFGNPKAGSPLMVCQQSIALDLPQKALVTQDAKGDVWLSYNDPAYLQSRHDIKGCDVQLKKITGALRNFARAATH